MWMAWQGCSGEVLDQEVLKELLSFPLLREVLLSRGPQQQGSKYSGCGRDRDRESHVKQPFVKGGCISQVS